MGLAMETLVVVAVVATAAVWFAARLYRKVFVASKASACGTGCEGCPSSDGKAAPGPGRCADTLQRLTVLRTRLVEAREAAGGREVK